MSFVPNVTRREDRGRERGRWKGRKELTGARERGRDGRAEERDE